MHSEGDGCVLETIEKENKPNPKSYKCYVYLASKYDEFDVKVFNEELSAIIESVTDVRGSQYWTDKTASSQA